MGTSQRLRLDASGIGPGWSRVAEALPEHIPPGEIGHIWIFPPFRTDGKEWGTAVIARELENFRFGIYTAKYMVIMRGKGQGHGRVEIAEVGASNADIIEEVLRGVQGRAMEPDPPAEIDPGLWFAEDDDESPS